MDIIPMVLLLTSSAILTGDLSPKLSHEGLAGELADFLVLDQVVGNIINRVDVVDRFPVVLASDLAKIGHVSLTRAFVVEIGHLVF